MLLAIDAGNSNIVIGLLEDENILKYFRISTDTSKTEDEYLITFRQLMDVNDIDYKKIDGAIVCSVVPPITSALKAAVKKLTGIDALVVNHTLKTGLKIDIDNPAQLGSDLVVAAVAGIQEYSCPLILIDMGTATTYSVIDEKKNYLGGLITTGMAVSADALVSRTSQLPRISFDAPKKVIGSNTIDCIKSGILYSNAAAIDGIVDRIEKELGKECTVVATGGLSRLVAPLCSRKLILDDDLLLKGLMYLYEKNA